MAHNLLKFHKNFCGASILRHILLLLLTLLPAWAIVDIAPVEVGEKPGVSGHLALAYAEKTGNTEKDEYDMSAKVQYDTNETSIFFIQGSYERTESGNTKIEDQKFIHGRYLYKLHPRLYAEAFVQYRQNIFKGIDQRLLSGGGARWHAFTTPLGAKVYLGLGAYDEQIDYYPQYVADDDLSDLRVNSYIAYKGKLSDSTQLNLIGYYQPSFDETDDYYASFLGELNVKIVGDFSLSLIYEIDYDSTPPQLVSGELKKQDRVIKTALKWKF
jgi:putative salt-induced outer membrane protein YdiY